MQLGAWGEERVARWYESQGYRVLDRNWRCARLGEIDVVAARGRLLVICEVKTRSTDAFGVPAYAVTPSKQSRLRKLAVEWMRERGSTFAEVRFDVAQVVGARLEVIEGAF